MNHPDIDLAGGMLLSKWRKTVGVSRQWVWKQRKAGKLPTVTRFGLTFITADTMRAFFNPDVPDQATDPLDELCEKSA